MKPVRVLIVDDSATMRGLIASTLGSDPAIKVVGEAANPFDAREAIKVLNPDVITLDVEMPKMDGLSFLEKIMRLRPTPVIMVSTLTSKGAEATIRALEIGAVDCVSKPTPGDDRPFADLANKVRMAAGVHLRAREQVPRNTQARSALDYRPGSRIVAIGASTGGVEALIEVISRYPANCPPTVITLHMPSPFTKSFAQRLDRLSAAHVSEAVDGAPIVPGCVHLAPGGPAHLEVAAGGQGPRCRLREADLVNGHRPSVDVLFASVAKVCGGNAVGVILTGMGRDGASALLSMRRAGAKTIGQNEASCVIYGMPKVAFEIGAVEKQVPLHEIAAEVLATTSMQHERTL
jgi:two-component system, chemotaxis family, protein-glutamate methylesterase/glutaminase